ncbi:dihydrofolate reductase family protein [Microbulbifer agarilyticus]|uniref:dihydrofolate reductase family protein n=1 Tax=Microbulbifer agarilyticus TaxID=260552 RepID=UPI001C938BB7|nr:dihydrofolate reductase family protein [Microbulbifer agarilyticus]MBY6210221.1 dihydrofolate reductase family protein [Microbulbifer agarilyticus]
MKCSVFIATSADGYIATEDGGVDWLQESGNQAADMTDNPDAGFSAFMASVDCLIMGRKCMEVISSMNLSAEQWPYGDIPIVVLSKTLPEPPANLRGKVEMFSGEIDQLIQELEERGLRHAYVDGGTTITAFLNKQLINEMIISVAPVLLGAGIPLFGRLDRRIDLSDAGAAVLANGFIQVSYTVSYG